MERFSPSSEDVNREPVRHEVFEKFIKGYELLTDDEWAYLLDNWDEYLNSPAKKSFKRDLVRDVASERPDIFSPSDERVKRATDPFIDMVKGDFDRLYELGEELRGDNLEEIVPRIAEYFAEKFEVPNMPDVAIKHIKNNRRRGTYNKDKNLITINVNNRRSVAGIIGTIAHETWHARQHQSGEQIYIDNDICYCPSKVDYDLYRKQILEREASRVGVQIGNMCRRETLARYPQLIPVLRKRYWPWVTGKYNPNTEESGIDNGYMAIIRDEYMNPIMRDIGAKLIRG